MLKILIIVLSVICTLYSLYFVCMAFGIFHKKKTKNNQEYINKFAILIAARNEEKVIAELINSLKAQDYPKDKFEIFTVVNNSNDHTEEAALKSGSTIIKCKGKIASKGDALKYAFNYLNKRAHIDVYAIFDADNIVDTKFLKNMNSTINNGYNVAQGYRDSKNINDNWLTSSYAIMYYIQSMFINKARFNMGKSAFLNGTGFIVKKSIIDKYGFNTKTITEDIEFTALCALNNEKIAFVEDAITYDEQVNKLSTSFTQRRRWSAGTVSCSKIYSFDLLKKALKERSLTCIDISLFYYSIILHVLSGVLSVLMVVYYMDNMTFILSNVLTLLISPLAMFIFGILFRIYVIKKNKKSIRNNLGGIFLFDLFILTFLPINFISLFISKCEWKAIKHESVLNSNVSN